MKNTVDRNGSWSILGLFVLFVNLFLFHSFGPFAGALLMMGVWALVNAMFVNKHNRQFSYLSLLTSGIIAFTVTQVSSPEKFGVLTLLFIASMIVWGYSMLKREWVSGLFELLSTPIVMGFSYLRGGIVLLVEMLSGNFGLVFGIKNGGFLKPSWRRSIFFGLIMAIPIVSWLVVTLSQADPIFGSFTGSFISEDFWGDWYPRIFLSVGVLCITSPLLLMQISKYHSPLNVLRKINLSREVQVVTALVLIVLGSFLVIQWPYVFADVAKETDLSQFGISTYSEYVQKGFGDLLKVALMVFGVAWAGLLLGRSDDQLLKKIHFSFQGVLALEFGIFIASMFRRVMLYQSYHGLSLARLYGLTLLVWIVGMMITMGMRYLYPKMAWVRVEIAWVMVVIISIIVLNPEKMVVDNPPTVNKRIDYVYLSRLPSDGYLGWINAYNWADEVLESNVKKELILSRDDRREIYYASLVAGRLAANYHDFVVRYGSEAECREYYKLVVQGAKANLADSLMTEKAVNEARVALEEYERKLDQDNWESAVKIYPNYGNFMYQNFAYPIEQNLDINLYLITGGEYSSLDKWDRLFGWSGADVKAYTQMKETIGVDGILKLSNNLVRVMKKISMQPKNEWDFEIDISLDAPFLR